MNENICVCCGAPIPEGRQVCWNCERIFLKVGSILQSYDVLDFNVEEPYEITQCEE